MTRGSFGDTMKAGAVRPFYCFAAACKTGEVGLRRFGSGGHAGGSKLESSQLHNHGTSIQCTVRERISHDERGRGHFGSTVLALSLS